MNSRRKRPSACALVWKLASLSLPISRVVEPSPALVQPGPLLRRLCRNLLTTADADDSVWISMSDKLQFVARNDKPKLIGHRPPPRLAKNIFHRRVRKMASSVHFIYRG